MRVVVCGSRDWTDPHPIRIVLLGLAHAALAGEAAPAELVVFHGDAPGADTTADTLTRQFHIPNLSIETHAWAADWQAHGRAAGPIRNQRILDEGAPDQLWAFITRPLDQSRGTADMVRRAQHAGLPIHIVTAGARR